MITKKYKAGDINIIAGSGGSKVVPNPETTPEDPKLTSLGIDDINYNIGGSGGGLSRVEVLPEPSEEAYNENKIYDQNNNLSYIGRDVNGTLTSKTYIKTDQLFGYPNMCLANNKIYFYSDSYIKVFNLDTKTLEATENIKSTFYGTGKFNLAYCPINNCIYGVVGESSSTKYVYKYNLNDPLSTQPTKISSTGINGYETSLVYCNNYLYAGNSGNMYRINPTNSIIEKWEKQSGPVSYVWTNTQMASDGTNIYFIVPNKTIGLCKYNPTTRANESIMIMNDVPRGPTSMCYKDNCIYMVSPHVLNWLDFPNDSLLKFDLKSKEITASLDLNTIAQTDRAGGLFVYNDKILSHNIYTGISGEFNNEITEFEYSLLSTYKSIPVGGGAEYEIAKIFSGNTQQNNEKVYTSSNVIFWIYMDQSTNVKTYCNIYPQLFPSGQVPEAYEMKFTGNSGSVYVWNASDTELKVREYAGKGVLVLAFRKKD